MRAFVTVFAAVVLSASALADLKVMDTEDVVRLLNGEEIRGTVIAVGIGAVILIVGEEERVVPRREVVSIERGEIRPTIKGYQTETVDGLKVVVGEGFRESESTGEGENAAAARLGGKKGARRGKGSTGRRKGSAISKSKVDELMKDPKVRDVVKRLGGRDKVMGMLEKNRSNPMVEKFMKEFLKTGNLPPGLESLFK